MTGFELYDCLKKDFPDAKETDLNEDEIVQLIRDANKTIRAHCGEVKRFSSPGAREAILDFLSRKGIFEITCGNWLYGGETGINPLISDLSIKGFLGKNAKCFYTSANALEQTLFGSTHAIVIDDGRHIFIEQPHGDAPSENQIGILLQDAYDLGEAFGDFKSPDFEYREVTSIDDDFIVESTVKDSDLQAREFFYKYNTEQQFNEWVMNIMN